jgi:uncharacterized protein (TIGR03067 family)
VLVVDGGYRNATIASLPDAGTRRLERRWAGLLERISQKEWTMRIVGFVLAVVVAQLAVAADQDAEARKSLVGTWNGRVDEGATGHRIVFAADGIRGTKDEKRDLGEGTFKLDLTQKPSQMDATGVKGSVKGKTYLGIYALDGDTLKWCVSLPGNERPTEFATKGSQFLLILKRQKDR